MNITATQFQLSVNEYFSKLSQGEDIVISRYGRPFARLVPFEDKGLNIESDAPVKIDKVSTPNEEVVEKNEVESITNDLTKDELVKIVKILIK